MVYYNRNDQVLQEMLSALDTIMEMKTKIRKDPTFIVHTLHGGGKASTGKIPKTPNQWDLGNIE